MSKHSISSYQRYLRWIGIVWVGVLFGCVLDKGKSASDIRDSKPPPLIPNSKVAFVSDRDEQADNGNLEIYIININGNGEVRLTHNPQFDGNPSFSHNGYKIVFDSTRDNYNREIYTMNDDGSNPKRLTHDPSVDCCANFSPDDRKIVFLSNRGGNFNVYVMNDDGSKPTRLNSQTSDHPVFSPDGRKIAYSASLASERGDYIFIMNADGSGISRLRAGREPSFSPDGSKIIYIYSDDLHIMDANGTHDHRLPLAVAASSPTFSPDSDKIAFVSDSSRTSARAAFFADQNHIAGKADIFIVNLDGSGLTRLTKSLGSNVSPAWGRSGSNNVMPTATVTPTPQSAGLVPTSIADDPLQTAAPSVFAGKLVYTFNDVKTPPFPSYLMLHSLTAKPETFSAPATFRIQGLEGQEGDFIFDPQLSPDNSQVLVKLGDPVVRLHSPYNAYRLVMWDRAANSFKPVSSRQLFFRPVSWSPDGNYVSYIAGGDAEGNTDSAFKEPLRLLVCNWRTGQEKLVVRNNAVRFNVGWLPPHTLLYSLLPPTPAEARQSSNQPSHSNTERPNIYEYSLETGKSQLLLRDGQRPTASPDSQWLAFFGSENINKPMSLNDDWWYQPGGASLLVAKRDGSGRKALTMEGGPYPAVVWELDNQHLLTLQQTQESPTAKATLTEWDIVSGHFRRIATLQAKGFPTNLAGPQRSVVTPQFQPLRFTPDGSALLVKVAEPLNQAATPFDEQHSVQAINLRSGAVTMIARLQRDSGLDWLSESPADTKPQ